MSEREWRFYVADMLRFAEKVREFSSGLDQATFESDELRYDTIQLHCLAGTTEQTPSP